MPARIHSWLARCLLLLAGLVSGVACGEITLRVAGFHFDLVPAIEFGWPDPLTLRDRYDPDPDVIWIRKDYPEIMRAARRSPPAVVFMGDSVTEFGEYPDETIRLLAEAGSPLGSGVKVGVGGWSSEQGVRQFERDILPVHPKVVTFDYGWNDHWIAMGLTDREILRARGLLALLPRLRLAQLGLKVLVGLGARRAPPPDRVPLPRYEENLRRMAEDARRAGIIPVFITAPSNHVPGHEPDYLKYRHLRSLSELIPLHLAYIQATRTVARDTGSPLCDVAAAFSTLPQPHNRYFDRDGIHMTPDGDRAFAKIVAGCLASLPR